MSETPRLFLTRAGKGGEDEEFALEQSLAVIGFRNVQSLQAARDFADVQRLVAQSMPNEPARKVGNYAGQLWAFVVSMADGDIVAMPCKGTGQISLGRVAGPYRYQKIGDEYRHTRPVRWIRKDVPRTAFKQDLLDSMGAFMTVCNIQRNEAAQRVLSVMNGGNDPGFGSGGSPAPTASAQMPPADAEENVDYERAARDKIIAFITANFREHDLTELVNAVLVAGGWVTKVSPKGPDGGVDIFAGRGLLGADSPRLVVEVKSQGTPADVSIYRGLKSTIHTFGADQGLLVCMGDFTKSVKIEAKKDHFQVRIWNGEDLVDAITTHYPNMSKEIQARLPMKPVWMLIDDETALG
jgi:restriction system protein